MNTYAFKFILLPVIVSVAAGIGSGARWYRTIFLEEISRDYVRTARAKALSEMQVLFRHVLRNGLIPILTGAVVVLPLLFTGSLVTESFFGIPGLGSYTIDAIRSQDFAIVQAMVFLGSCALHGVRVLPAVDGAGDELLIAYAQEIIDELRAGGISADVDFSNNPIDTKIAMSESPGIDTMLIVHKHDVASGSVGVRIRGTAGIGKKSRGEAIAGLIAGLRERRN